MDYFFILMFTGVAALMVGGALLLARIVAPRSWTRAKGMPYECGELTIGPAWIQFNVGYYLFALLFLVFDVEAAFLFPWALVFRELGLVALVEASIFIAILLLGLAYAWRKGVLEWM